MYIQRDLALNSVIAFYVIFIFYDLFSISHLVHLQLPFFSLLIFYYFLFFICINLRYMYQLRGNILCNIFGRMKELYFQNKIITTPIRGSRQPTDYNDQKTKQTKRNNSNSTIKQRQNFSIFISTKNIINVFTMKASFCLVLKDNHVSIRPNSIHGFNKSNF